MPDEMSADGGMVTKTLPVPARVLVPLPNAYEERVRRARRLRFSLFAGRAFADAVLLVVAFIAAYWLRYGVELGRDVIAPESFKPPSDFYPYIVAFTALTMLAF